MKEFYTKFSPLIVPALLLLQLSGCLDSQPKIMSTGLLNIFGNNSSNAQYFQFSYAFGTSNAGINFVVLQGSDNSASAITSTCNSAGTSCQCIFMDSTGAVLTPTAGSASVYLNTITNQIFCSYAGITPYQVQLTNIAQQVSSTNYTIINSLTRQQIIGSLNGNNVRSISQYFCYYNFLEKWGTQNPTTFNCTKLNGPSGQAAQCDPSGGDFCILQSAAPFYLYGDNISSNVTQKYSSLPYPYLCGNQQLQYDCTTSIGNPTVQFGVYGTQSGMFQLPVSYIPSPNSVAQNYGFAAATMTMPIAFGGGTMCPPGLIAYSNFIFTLNVTTIAGILYDPNTNSGNNIPPPPNNLTFMLAASTSTVTSFLMNRIKDANCSPAGGLCSTFTNINTPILNQNYAPTGSTYCVFPASVLN